jgi:hypothetical protein
MRLAHRLLVDPHPVEPDHLERRARLEPVERELGH